MNITEENCARCGTGKKYTMHEWHKCPWQMADTLAETEWCFLPRFITRWWYFRKNPSHLAKDEELPETWGKEQVMIPPVIEAFSKKLYDDLIKLGYTKEQIDFICVVVDREVVQRRILSREGQVSISIAY